MRTRTKLAFGGATVSATVLAYVRLVRPWEMRWGATDEEVRRPMPGDAWIADPGFETTKAITIDAAPEDIWPWLVQMGNGRGGLYSFDFLDRLFGFVDAPSANEILSEYQHLAPGDMIPIGRGDDFPVQSVEANRSLVLAGEANGTRWTWQFGLFPQFEGGTRLVSRNRATVRGIGPRVGLWLAMEPAAFVTTRQMLVNLKRRAERLRRERHAAAEADVLEQGVR